MILPVIPDGIRRDIYPRELNARIEDGYYVVSQFIEEYAKRAGACSRDLRLPKGRNDLHDQVNLVTFLLEHN
jgi:hypothetical protein